MNKRFLALLLAFTMMFTFVPGISIAAEDTPGTSASAPVPGAAAASSSLVAWYTFEADTLSSGVSGSRKALDSSGNGNDATMYWSEGAFETVDGIDGASLNFNNGTRSSGGAYVQLPSDILSDTDTYTISAWFKLTSTPSWARLFDFGSVEAGPAATRKAYIMYAPYSWHTQALLESTADFNQGTKQIPFTGSNRLNEWVHIDITRDSKATNIYMNGTLYATGTAGLSPRGYDFLGAYLGRSGFEGDNFFDGQMDDVRIYNRALTADDVLEQYRSYPAIAGIETSGGPYLMSYTLPAGFSGHLADSATPATAAIQQVGIFDYSLHYAYSEDGKTWIPLNDNRGLLYWRDNGAYSANTSYRYLYPRIVLIDGLYHLYADAYRYQNNAVANTYLHWTSTDLINWTQIGLETALPEIPANPATIDTTAKPYNSTLGNVISISEAQLTALKDTYATPYFDDVNLTTTVGVPADLPDYGTISLANGRQVNYGHSVTWDGEPDYETPGVYEITGTVNYDYTNPVNRNGADPQIYYHDGWYYYTSSWMDDSIPAAQQNERNQYMNVTLRRARTIAGLVTTQTAAESRELGYPEEKMVFQGPTGNSERGSAHIWAPEIHRVTFDGKSTWVVIFAGSPLSSKWNIQMMVSVCDSDDPWTGNWTTSVLEDGNTSNNFDLDATILEHNGKTYLIWANTRSGRSSLWIAEMTSPTTINTNTAQQTMLLTPEYTFENRNDRVLEGATILKEDGKIWLSYSVGSTNSNYNMGLAYAIDSPTTDVMLASSWTKLKYPIMHSNRASKQFGPGHAAFEYDYDGAGGAFPILSYHARGNEDYATNHAPAPLYSPTRWARIAPVYFHRDGTPYVGIAPADGEIPAMPIKGTITVLPADQITLTPINKTFKPAAEGYTTAASEVFTVINPTDEIKTLSLSLSGDAFSLSAASVDVPASGQATFSVTPIAGLAIGTYTGSVTVKDGDVERTANFSFSVLETAPDRYADSSFDLTALAPSATSETTSYITNAGTQVLNGFVIQALYNGDRLEKTAIEPFAIEPGLSTIVKSSLVLPATLTDEHTLKCFVWDGSYAPISAATAFKKIDTAELPNPYVWYDFNQDGATANGTVIPDMSGNGRDGNLNAGSTGTATWTGDALRLTNTATTSAGTGKWVNAPRGMMDGKDTFTLSLYASQSVSNSGQFRFAFGIQQNPAGTAQRYFFFTNTGKYKAAITTASNGGESAGGNIEIAAANMNKWEHYIVVLTPTSMKMYVDGKLVQSVPTTVTISDLGTNLNVDLGRSCWNGDTLWAGSYGDFRIYDTAFDEAQVKELTSQITQKTDPRLPQTLVDDWASLTLSKPSGSTLTGPLGVIPAKGTNGSTITWGATNPVYLSVDGTVRRPSDEDGDQTAVLIATLTAPTGEKVTKSFVYLIEAVSDAGDVLADTAALMIGSDPFVDGLDLNDFEMDAILPSVGPGGNTTVEWATSDESVMTIDGKNHVTHGQKNVTLTATIRKGNISATKEFNLTCKPPLYGYLLAYFIGNSASQQQNFLALSPDGLNFTWLNNNTKIMEITEGEKAARDHFIIKDPNQEMYYMLATDLDSNKSSVSGWRDVFGYPSTFTNTWGNKAIFVWKSEDLINWTLASHTNFSGLDSTFDMTRGWGNSWAPEAIWVEDHDNGDGTTGAFMMFWSSSPQRLTNPSYSGYTDRNRIVCAFTKDFSQGSFSQTQELYFISDAVADQIIDACIEWDPAIERWQMYFRRGSNSTAHIERVTSVGTSIPSSTAGWTNRVTVPGTLGTTTGSGYEGPDMNKVIGKQEWRMIADHFTSPEAFRIFKTTDFLNFTEIASPATNIGMSLAGIGSGGRVRHGAIIRITRERYEELEKLAGPDSWVY